MGFGGARVKPLEKYNSLPNSLKLMKFGVGVQNNELQNIVDFFFKHEVIPFKAWVIVDTNIIFL